MEVEEVGVVEKVAEVVTVSRRGCNTAAQVIPLYASLCGIRISTFHYKIH